MDIGIGLPNPIRGAPGRLLVDMLDPTVASLDQVDRLADAVL